MSKITRWKVIRIYKLNADSKKDALAKFHENPADYLEVTIVKEDDSGSLWGSLKKQVTG